VGCARVVVRPNFQSNWRTAFEVPGTIARRTRHFRRSSILSRLLEAVDGLDRPRNFGLVPVAECKQVLISIAHLGDSPAIKRSAVHQAGLCLVGGFEDGFALKLAVGGKEKSRWVASLSSSKVREIGSAIMLFIRRGEGGFGQSLDVIKGRRIWPNSFCHR
jgi:hypothetical protein